MEHLTKQETVEALKELFDYKNNKESKNVLVVETVECSTKFMVNKQYMERFEVIDKLHRFFSDKVIDNGQCRIGSITFVFTVFFIEDRSV